jgi:hypothetical protein
VIRSSRRKSAPAARAAPASQADFLVLSIMSAVVPMIEARCGALNKRDRGTLQRHVEKAVRQFVAGANPAKAKSS